MWRAILLVCIATPIPGEKSRPNQVVDVTTTCDKGAMTVHLEMEQPFKGLLPSNACGVRTSPLNSTRSEPDDDEDLYYNAELVVQMDRQLQQSSDQEIHVRTGRNRQGFSSSLELEQREWLMQAARAWMELSPAVGTTEPATVEVGQQMRLLIQCTLPEASQKLLDEAGCPVDEGIFSKPTIHHHKHKSSEIEFSDLEPVDPVKNLDENTNLKMSRIDPEHMLKNIMTYQHAVTTFSAFKFPDRAKLHLTCGIELCKGLCPPVDCRALQRPQQTRDGLLRKARLDKDAKGIVIDRLEVYNSSRRVESEDDFVRGFSPGDRTICMSPGKMALAFCVLGVIFLCAIAVAFISLIRARKRIGREPLHTSLSFYTGSKSMFSSSESSSSGLSGSKLLLTDSPYFDHHSSSSNNWPYARAF
ncbi:Uncharacterized protein OBRU01_02091 [Operophtera brumata]|uniref:ZP domain-containing protein n=1 Tax=Operophtera brumata TaxID=104452 RepID=A0A0L7LT82_OPEBR|nr:Uncharacterized protein OBRU01_02091 [Operophtera brumata]